MKLDETTVDDEKENTCNENGLHEKPIVKKLPAPELSNGDLNNDSGSSDPPGVGDLLVEDTNATRHENEEHGYQNGSRGDDSTSVSSSSSNFPITEQDELSEEDEEITLRLSEDEDLPVPVSNETDNYTTSSACPNADDDKNKREDKPSSSEEDNPKSETVNEPVNNMKEEIANNDNNHSESEILSEQTDDKDSSVDKSNDKNSSVEKSDDNLDNLISDLTEQSKSALKSESEKVTISELRKEIEDFIKNHDNDGKDLDKSDTDSDSSKTEHTENVTESVPEPTESKSAENDLEIKISEPKTVAMEIDNENIDNDNETSEKEDNDNEISEEQNNDHEICDDIDIEINEIKLEHQENNELNEIKVDYQENDSSKMKVEPSTSEMFVTKVKTEEEDSEIKDTITENISDNASENITERVSENDSKNITENISENITESVSENITGSVSENITEIVPESISENVSKTITENDSGTKNNSEIVSENISKSISKDVSESISDDLPEVISETIKENNDENTAAETNNDTTEPKVDENKKTETINLSETTAKNTSELFKSLKTKKTYESCQEIDDSELIDDPEIIDDPEMIEPETPSIEASDSAEKQETETNPESPENDKPETICVENNTKDIENNTEDKEKITEDTENNSDKENSENKDECIDLMEVDSNEKEPETKTDDKDNADTNTILIDDDVEMKEDYEKNNRKEDNKTNDQKEKPVEEKDAFDKLKEDEKDVCDKLKEDVFDKLKEDDIKQAKKEIKPGDASKKDQLKGEKDEPKTSLKRSLENDEDQQDVKKPKINGVKKPRDPDRKYFKLDVFREFMSKKSISTLTRAELEQFCLQKMCEAITQTSKIGDLNRKIMQQETMLEALRTKHSSLTKQVRDLEVVHSRVLQEVRTKCKEANIEITPVKITRSVGLQVTLQAITGRVRTIAPQPHQEQPAVVAPAGVKRKLPQRASLPSKLPASSPPSAMPPPKPPVRSPNQGKGIKTILPKVYPPADTKDPNASLLENYLQQNPGTSKTLSPVRKSAPGGGSSVSSTSTSATSSPKVIDLTDEDDAQKTPATPTTTAIRVVASQQLTTTTPVSTASLPRLTYLVQGSQQGQQVLLATSTPPTRPGQVRSTLMFKPVAPGQVPQGQRLNIVRQNVPGITVIPTSSASTVRPGQQIRFTTPTQNARPQVRAVTPARHPAPLPGPPAVQPSQPNWKAMPPKPTLKISRVGDGIVLSWRMQNNKDMSLYEDIGSYQLYAYQETSGPPSTDMWRKVGDVKALALPMACTLTQFTDGNKYHFAVRAVDVKSRVGPFSQPEQIALP